MKHLHRIPYQSVYDDQKIKQGIIKYFIHFLITHFTKYN